MPSYTRAPVPRGPLKRSLLFLHVPKTGGSTLTGVLSNRFAPDDCLSLYFGPEPDLKDLDRFRYITGHVGLSFLEQFERPPFVFTFIRDPIDRALSSYSYTRAFPPEYQPDVALLGPELYERWQKFRRLARECSIGELIDRDPEIARAYFGNRQARALGSMAEGDERLDDALDALERVDFVGVSERLEESADWLARRLGWRELSPVPRSNVSAARLSREQLPAETMDALLELTSVDRELYALALRRQERLISEWSEAADPRDPSAEIPDAPAIRDLRFDGPIPGGGWLARERLGEAPGFCWISDSRRGFVDLASDQAADSLVVEIPHVLDPEILQSLRISVDGTTVRHDLSEREGATVATAPLGRHVFSGRDPTTRVTIEVDRSIRPCDLDPQSIDDRELAVAVSRVALCGS
jgi:hypothetical protein